MQTLTDTNIRIANAPCSWGALEFELEGKSAGFEQVLDEIAETGYLGTELGDWGFMPTDPSELRKQIDARSLTLLGAFVPVALADQHSHQDGIAKALRVSALMYDAGYSDAFIVLADENGSVESRTRNAGRIEARHQLDESARKIFAAGTEKIARAVKDAYNMRTVFHHHCAGYIETPDEIEDLMNMTDPELVGLCFDSGHYMFGGGNDAEHLLRTYWSRIWHVHFKDFSMEIADQAKLNEWDYFDSVKNGVFCELGKGAVDFPSIKKVLAELNYDGWIVVEQDVLPGMGNPKICAMNNRKYLQSIGL